MSGTRLNFFKAPDIQGTVGNGNTLQVYLPGGPTYEELRLVMGGVGGTVADIAFFRVSVEGEERVKLTGQQMLDRAAYDGKTATSGHYAFSFSDHVARRIDNEIATGLVTQPNDRVLVEIDLAASGIAGTETFTLYCETSPNRKEEAKLFCIPENVPITKIGDNDFEGFREGKFPGHKRMRRAFCYGNITHLQIEQDGRYPFGKKQMPIAVNDALLKSRGKTPPTSSTCFTFDPIRNGNVVTDMLDLYTTQSTNFTFTTADSNNITAITEYVELVVPAAA